MGALVHIKGVFNATTRISIDAALLSFGVSETIRKGEATEISTARRMARPIEIRLAKNIHRRGTLTFLVEFDN